MQSGYGYDLLMRNGKNCLERGEFRQAVELFSEALRLAPGDCLIHLELGKACYQLKDYRRAIGYFELCKDHDGTKYNAGILKAKSYHEMGDSVSAAKEINRLLTGAAFDRELEKERKEFLVACVMQARGWNNEGKSPEALAVLNEIYSAIPDTETFLKNLVLSEIEIAGRSPVMKSNFRSIVVPLTTACNLRCIMCDVEERAYDWTMPERTLREIVACMPYLERVVWHGGEVFLHKGLERLVREAGRYGNVRQIITTNGLLVDEKWAEILIDHGVDMTFSVDGVTREVYEKIRVGARHDVLLRNLRRFGDYRQKTGKRTNMNLHVVIMRSNYRQLEQFVDFAHEYGFNYVMFFPIGGNLDSAENIFHRPDPSALRCLEEALPHAREKAQRYGIMCESRLPVKEYHPLGGSHSRGQSASGTETDHAGGRTMGCHLPWIQMYIHYDGSVRPDCICPCDRSIGNVRDSSLDALWNSAQMQEYRRRIAGNNIGAFCGSECVQKRIAEKYLKFA